jgi:hypothetical protein
VERSKEMKYPWRATLKKNIEERYIHNPKEWYQLTFSTNGFVSVTIVSGRFANIPDPQREEQIVELLRESGAPVQLLGHSLCTLREADSRRLSQWSRPASRASDWLDLADQAINVTEYPKVPQRKARIPHTVTFYSLYMDGYSILKSQMVISSTCVMRTRNLKKGSIKRGCGSIASLPSGYRQRVWNS